MKKLIVTLVLFGSLSVFSEEPSRSYSSVEDKKIIQNALESQYGERITDIEFKTLYNPLFQLGNAAMKLQPILKKISKDYIIENEIVYRVQYSLDKKFMNCLAIVSDMKATKKIKVNVGTCNQGMKDIIHWKDEFTRYEDVPAALQQSGSKSKRTSPAVR